MTSSSFSSPNDEFDLTCLLWADSPSATTHEPTGQSQSVEPNNARADEHFYESAAEQPQRSSTDAATQTGPDRLWPASSFVELEIASTSAQWSGEHHKAGSQTSESIDDADAESSDSGLDLDALAWSAELAQRFDLEQSEFEPHDDGLDEFSHITFEERALSFGELTDRLNREVLPHLKWLARNRGYLTIGYLAGSVVALQDSDSHLTEVVTFLERMQAPVLPSRSHRASRSLPSWAIEKAKRRFKNLIRDHPDEAIIIQRLGFGGLYLAKATRIFLVQAWTSHCLSRAEERAYAQIVASEIARVGLTFEEWSPQARAARDALILDNLWTVVRIVRRYVGRGVDLDDLIQVGTLGLFRGVEKFDPELGNRLMTYASQWIFQSIMRHIGDASRLIRLPIHAHDQGEKIVETCKQLRESLHRSPTFAEIADACTTSETIVRAHLVTTQVLSMYDPDVVKQLSSMVDQASDNPVLVAESEDLKETIRRVLSSVPERERAVLELRFGLDDGEIRTLEEVGREFGVTRERIRQIESKALKHLRHPSRAKVLRDYFRSQEPTRLLDSAEDVRYGVSIDLAHSLIDLFTFEERRIIAFLWSADGDRPQSIASTTRTLNITRSVVEHTVRELQSIAKSNELTEFRLGTNAELQFRSEFKIHTMQTTSRSLTPIKSWWFLTRQDRNSADWAMRIAIEATASPSAARVGIGQSAERVIDSSAVQLKLKGIDGIQAANTMFSEAWEPLLHEVG